MMRTFRCLVPILSLVLALSFANGQDGKKYTIKTANAPAPKELSEAIQKLLGESSVQLLDGGGEVVCDVWFRKDLPAEATSEQLKSGVTYREVKQTEILGAIQFHKNWTDYRNQKIKAGVYVLRLAYQPTDGKHTADVSDYQDFALLTTAKADTKPGLMEAKALHDKSADSLELAHPAVFMLWPNTKPGKEPDLASRPKNHWVLNTKCNLVVGGKAADATIGIGLNLVGHSPVE
jgi:hypothetical protein